MERVGSGKHREEEKRATKAVTREKEDEEEDVWRERMRGL